MPLDYRCEHCGLGFTLGWFHYEGGGPFAAATCLVCASCGTAHMIEHAVDPGARDAMWAAPAPNTGHFAPEEGHLKPYPLDVDLRPRRREQWSSKMEGSGDALNLADVPCASCATRGNFRTKWPQDERRCPHCHQEGIKLVQGWVT